MHGPTLRHAPGDGGRYGGAERGHRSRGGGRAAAGRDRPAPAPLRRPGPRTPLGGHHRSQYFDKLVVWGGGEAITNAARYVGPGFQLIAFDPKVSMALIGREAVASERSLREAADLAAADVTVFNQDACVVARHICVEGGIEQVDRFCALLYEQLGMQREFAPETGGCTPGTSAPPSRRPCGPSTTSYAPGR
ncbi:acyl-CoA reductase [Streptomyces mirabilis]